MAITKNFGQVVGLIKGISPPTITSVLWFDTSEASAVDALKIFDDNTTSWIRLVDAVNAVANGTDLSFSLSAVAVTIESSTGANTTVPQATPAQAGVQSAADKSKLDGIEPNAKDDQVASEVPITPVVGLTATQLQQAIEELKTQVDSASSSSSTDLNAVPTATQITVESSTGADAVLGLATGSQAGLMSPAQNTKLAGIDNDAENNDGESLGSAGADIYAGKSGSNIQIRKIQSGDNISITVSPNGQLIISTPDTDLSATPSANEVTLSSSTGNTISLPVASLIQAGIITASQFQKIENSATKTELQNSSTTYAQDTGSSSAYEIALTPTLTAYSEGQGFRFKAANTNSIPATLEINGLGPISLIRNSGAALEAGDIIAGSIVDVGYDGTNFRVISVSESVGGGTVTEAQIQNGSFVFDVDAGAADAYDITLAPAITAYLEGQQFTFKAVSANTGASTLDVNGIGAVPIIRRDGLPLQPGDIPANSINVVVYDQSANGFLLVSDQSRRVSSFSELTLSQNESFVSNSPDELTINGETVILKMFDISYILVTAPPSNSFTISFAGNAFDPNGRSDGLSVSTPLILNEGSKYFYFALFPEGIRIIVPPNSASSDVTLPTLSNFRIESSNPDRILFDSSEPITGTTFAGFTVASPSKTISSININSGATTGHYFVVSVAFVQADNPTISYDGNDDWQDTSSNSLASFAATPITNNIVTVPSITSATVEDSAKADLVVVFSEVVTITDTTGLSLNFTTGTAKTLTGAVSGSGTNTLTFTIGSDIENGDIFTLEVLNTNNIINGASNNVNAVSQPITNNVAGFSPSSISPEHLWIKGDNATSTKDGGTNRVTVATDSLPTTPYNFEGDVNSGPLVVNENGVESYQIRASTLIMRSSAPIGGSIFSNTFSVYGRAKLDDGQPPATGFLFHDQGATTATRFYASVQSSGIIQVAYLNGTDTVLANTLNPVFADGAQSDFFEFNIIVPLGGTIEIWIRFAGGSWTQQALSATQDGDMTGVDMSLYVNNTNKLRLGISSVADVNNLQGLYRHFIVQPVAHTAQNRTDLSTIL